MGEKKLLRMMAGGDGDDCLVQLTIAGNHAGRFQRQRIAPAIGHFSARLFDKEPTGSEIPR